ncbi:hypothetical protein HMPREF1624_07523 [Sporothrix schenckii ATCC 58251]|uniref:Nuclear membrane fusion protein Kar5 n=1 Tax=Sporothrix schenckii (strain ATCC 58251 / de Perez 2211183) TaxID=1391915 RepID=U7PK23_SPOS1|nr:hypothetical protein HMPREF1624_07523 [Sporothrix schenckii ATCC 58251]
MYFVKLLATLLVSCNLFLSVTAIPWISTEPGTPARISPSDLLQAGATRSALYQAALTELQELEAEPLCHRVAARLLVNNCQILEGKDDATVLTDSGRRARDFVDSYAASLAICDLERASFSIPPACEPFREPTLSRTPLSDTAQLHVPEAQIRACLAGLGESPSAWNTWVSYSHKAVRFCEAARADYEKTQNILVFQKLTRVMAKLTDDVEAELQRRTEVWDAEAQGAADRLGHVLPVADALLDKMVVIESLLHNDLMSLVRETATLVEDGSQSARTLQQVLRILVKTVLESNSELAFEHERSIARVNQVTQGEMDAINAAMQGVYASALSLQREIELSQLQASDLTSRQEALGKGMLQLEGMTQAFFSDFDAHSRLLVQAKNMTNDMLDTLEATAAATWTIQNSFRGYGELGGWWPFIVCPAVSLIMGSYGLPPSILRNIGLFTLGELAGAVISYHNHIHNHLGTVAGVLFTFAGMVSNTTGTVI